MSKPPRHLTHYFEELDPEQIESWLAPDVTDEERLNASTDVFGHNRSLPKRVATPSQDEELKPLTAADLEEIRALAREEGYQEGFEAGHAEGVVKGEQDGFASGEAAGKTEGFEQGLAEGAALIEERARAWEALARQLHAPLSEVDKQVEQQLLQLVVALAEEVIRTELHTNPAVIINVLHEALSVLPLAQQRVTIKLHPDDLALIEMQYDSDAQAERNWHLLAEPVLARGDCQVSCENSQVDVNQKQRVKDLLERFLHQPVERIAPELSAQQEPAAAEQATTNQEVEDASTAQQSSSESAARPIPDSDQDT